MPFVTSSFLYLVGMAPSSFLLLERCADIREIRFREPALHSIDLSRSEATPRVYAARYGKLDLLSLLREFPLTVASLWPSLVCLNFVLMCSKLFLGMSLLVLGLLQAVHKKCRD